MFSGLRIATREDIPAMHRVRLAVRENRLNSNAIAEADYLPAIENTGRGWVATEDGAIVGFAIGNARTGNIWALFVHPDHERCGHGRRLHDAMIEWLRTVDAPQPHLGTAPGTRAQRFYEAAGWTYLGLLPNGDAQYVFRRPDAMESE